MRVLFDTNIFVSYLVTGFHESSAIGRLFSALAREEFALILPNDVVTEVLEKVEYKPAIAARIDAVLAREFMQLMREVAHASSTGEVAIAPLARDPDDDVVLAYAVAEDVDYLITGDKDLLVLGDVLAPLKIRTPQAFLEDLEELERDQPI